ncbi:MAG: YigZ family protein [Bacteroidaceae bacterium]|nr:YigZ family protein [Bacteroidaceae bacterium]
MLENDVYKTIDVQGEGIYSEKRSKFLAFAIPVLTLDDVKREVEAYQKKYYDARHVCYAYRLGERRELFRANDNGEPSGTAGKPILGQIDSRELTNVLVIVVRYFGGIKLGTSGLIVAYKAAAAEALDATVPVEKTINEEITLKFSYPLLNDVLRIVKEENPRIVEQIFDNECVVKLSIRLSRMPRLRERYEKLVIDSRNDLRIVDDEE